MKPRTTVILLALLAGCIVFIVLRAMTGRRGAPGAEGSVVEVFSPPPAGAKEFVLESADGTRMVFVKDAEAWNIREPIIAKADSVKVQEIVDLLLGLRGVRVEESLGDDITGLGAPLWTLTLKDTKDETYRMAVGQALPLTKGDRTYVRSVGSGRVYAVAMDFAVKLGQPVSEFRSKTLLSAKSDNVVRVSVAGKETFELVRDKADWTVIAKGFTARADQEKVKDLLDSIVEVGATDFVADKPENLALYGLDNPRLVVRVQVMAPQAATSTTTGSAPTTRPVKEYALALGEKMDDKVYARLLDSPAVYEVYYSILESLQPSVDGLRDHRVFSAPEGKVASVEIALADGNIRLTGGDGKWRMESPYSGKASEQAVKNLLQRVTQLKAESFEDKVVSPATFGLDTPRATITLNYAGGSEPLKLLIGAKSESGELTFVKSAAPSSPVAAIRNPEAEAMMVHAAEYWDTPILAVPPAEKVVGLEIAGRSDGDITLVPRVAGTWSLEKPISAPAQSKPVNEMISEVRDITATGIVSLDSSVPEQYAKADNLLTVKVTTELATASQPASEPVAEGAARTTYAFRVAKIGGDSFVWTEGGKITAVGKMNGTFYDTFSAELRALRIGSTSEEPVDLVRITAGKESLELRRQGGQWVCPADPHMRLDNVKVDGYIRDANWMRCERFVRHTSTDPARYGLDKPATVVEFVFASGSTYRFAIAAGAGGANTRYACASGVEGVFVLSAESVKALARTAADFQD